jgi:hypothetical protein
MFVFARDWHGPIFRLQEEEPQLSTDTEQQEHFGNEAARTARARFSRFRIIRMRLAIRHAGHRNFNKHL